MGLGSSAKPSAGWRTATSGAWAEHPGGAVVLQGPPKGGIPSRHRQPPLSAPFQQAMGVTSLQMVGTSQQHRPAAWGAAF
mmetsp:Transcript_35526/g.90461  ORF Transcript_35526/g.90461 Transcript_35526/m.90461 type:complete len:80 (+) Transcript_35526:3-242(+)